MRGLGPSVKGVRQLLRTLPVRYAALHSLLEPFVERQGSR